MLVKSKKPASLQEDLKVLYPFLSNTALEQLVLKDLVENIASFLKSSFLGDVVRQLVQIGEMDLIVSLALLGDSSVLSEIIKGNIEQ